MFVTVIIGTRNRAGSLKNTLDSLLCPSNLEEPDWEVVVVDNASTDGTPAVCVSFTARFPERVRFVVEEKRGVNNARNAGVGIARGDVVAVTDDDVLVASDYIPAIRKVFTEHPADAAQGKILLDLEGGRPDWMDDRMMMIMGNQDHGNQVIEWKRDMASGNMIVRADVFTKVGGFCPHLGSGTPAVLGGDTEFSFRMLAAGCRMIYAPQIVVRHQVSKEQLTKQFFRERYFRKGRALAYIDPPPVGLCRFGLYATKELVFGEMKSLWYRAAGQPAKALRCQCDARVQLGTLWQHWKFWRGVPRDLQVGPMSSQKG